MINIPTNKLIPKSKFSNKFTVFAKNHPIKITFSNATGFLHSETILQNKNTTFDLRNLYSGIASILFTSNNEEITDVNIEMF